MANHKPQLPMYLLTEIGTVWVLCKSCKQPIPIWQAGDEGQENAKFTCIWCKGEALKSEQRQPVPKFKNLTAAQQASLKGTPAVAKVVVEPVFKVKSAFPQRETKQAIMKQVAGLMTEAGMDVPWQK